MATKIATSYLGPVEDATRQQLGGILWDWRLCGKCSAKSSCGDIECPWNPNSDCNTFWNLYEQMATAYNPERLGRKAAIANHEELLGIVKQIKARKNTPRKDILRDIFEVDGAEHDEPPTSWDQNRAFNIAASLLLLVDLNILHDAANISSGRAPVIPWRDDASVETFIEEALPPGSALMSPNMQYFLPDLRAKKLSKHAKLHVRATNDIRRHLLLDKKEKIVWVFHQSTALRQLLSSMKDGTTTGVLPRDLILEVLHTIHNVLFPPDPGSQKLLRRLVRKHGWDKGLELDTTTPERKYKDPDISFKYFGQRLEELYDEMQTPTPHTWLHRRLKKREDAYVLMVAMYGVIVAVVCGFLTLVTAIFQSWVAWQQWKHPVN
ncbi:hypothetical protein HBI56_115590 [Parastagonospora nodorum]|uniref:Uncharacterized protein n=1 Tax=Phaeosphaeria nodorum (strain SN15 / ATCC MYA-4574 / FGSC 10173) TaxID=321614 RepID=A0A7U2F8B8_PHANO|nr:hypothetical protein HBH56_196450 [Parastagonospora nodorum]QRD00614.1 hypothetical protein JI435_091630 [Parastagonospora nodorum SN15]KAH3924987.1 hypothetical protein HBH54_187040 [Parastagonospora nodorum]KAH3953261.1 hypothetical protein HBH53_039180 [Parastagonospora nodorum]KAH3976287.1 hypothetical protein HBH52_119300 [Parastagonospora nodorum]